MREPLHRRFARAAVITTFNPFAQLARLGVREPSKRNIRSVEDIEEPFKKKQKPDTNKRPGSPIHGPAKIHKANPASPVTPEKAKKPTVVPISAKKKTRKPIKVALKPKMNRVEDDDEVMDSSEAEATPAVAASRASTGASGGMVKETPITRAIAEYGLPATHTAILPYTCYFSFICPQNHTDPLQRFQFRLNSIIDSVVTVPTTPTTSSNYETGIFNQPVTSGPAATTWPATARSFPRTLGSTNAEAAQWQNWFTAMYRYYAVLGCEYTITVFNSRQQRSRGIVVGTYIDTFSANNNTQIHPGSATLAQMEHWPDVQFYTVESTGDPEVIDQKRTIQGRYKCGSAFRNVENDEDVRTWTRTNTTPTYQENMSLVFGRSWMNDFVDQLTMGMVRVQLRYIVQFKDLITPFRWPAGQTPVNFAVPDLLQQNQ